MVKLRRFEGRFFVGWSVAGGVVRSGNITMLHGYLWFGGADGAYWSKSGYAENSAYDFGFNATRVFPSNGPYNRYNGYSLRCLQE